MTSGLHRTGTAGVAGLTLCNVRHSGGGTGRLVESLALLWNRACLTALSPAREVARGRVYRVLVVFVILLPVHCRTSDKRVIRAPGLTPLRGIKVKDFFGPPVSPAWLGTCKPRNHGTPSPECCLPGVPCGVTCPRHDGSCLTPTLFPDGRHVDTNNASFFPTR
ncbi:hypothetical protein VUR80DRAFT_6544 [Thermomyces stellatus]